MNHIGLDEKSTVELSEKLNQLLATYQIHYQNLRGLHWNVAGDNFFEMHLKYEELYTRTQIIIDDVAERVLTLGSQPLHTFTSYLKHAKIEELDTTSDAREGMQYLLDSQKELLVLEREILELSSAANDEGTNSFISDLIREKEKNSWMFRAWLGK